MKTMGACLGSSIWRIAHESPVIRLIKMKNNEVFVHNRTVMGSRKEVSHFSWTGVSNLFAVPACTYLGDFESE